MDTADLSRLEEQIGRLLRVGVVLCAIALGLGLALAFAGNAWASPLLRIGLAILMAIPVTRIAASFFDAMRRRDALLASSTAIVLLVMALTLLYSLRSIDVDAAVEVTHSFSVDLTLAPGGKRMAYVANLNGRDQLFVVTLGKNDPARLLSHAANDDAPAWSPDGKRIAFVSDITGSLEIFTVNADGSDVKQITHDEAASIYPSWAPDGERLAYCLKINQRRRAGSLRDRRNQAGRHGPAVHHERRRRGDVPVLVAWTDRISSSGRSSATTRKSSSSTPTAPASAISPTTPRSTDGRPGRRTASTSRSRRTGGRSRRFSS